MICKNCNKRFNYAGNIRNYKIKCPHCNYVDYGQVYKEEREVKGLKTLKDFEWWKAPNINRELSVEVYRLRQEAIKWVKHSSVRCPYCFQDSKEKYCADHKFWMERFNLTEEDLE